MYDHYHKWLFSFQKLSLLTQLISGASIKKTRKKLGFVLTFINIKFNSFPSNIISPCNKLQADLRFFVIMRIFESFSGSNVMKL